MPFIDLKDMDVENKKVIVRVGMDVSVDMEGNIIDDGRIVSCIPTIQYLIDKNAKVILLLHIGRPKGNNPKEEPHLTTDAVTRRLSRMLFRDIKKIDSCTGKEVKKAVEEMKPGEIIFLENLRFHEGEKKNCPEFSKQLAELGDVYINECFSVSHREHASMVGIPEHLPSCGGFCLRREIDILKRITENPEKPLVAVLGGVKGDKVNALKSLIEKADKILIGGGLSFLFLKLRGYSIGNSKVDAEWLSDNAKKEILDLAKNEKIILPADYTAAKELSEDAEHTIMDSTRIHSEFMGLDIGPRTIAEYKKILDNAKTIIWAGPMGAFETDKFSSGTREIAKHIAELSMTKGITTVVGGGESASAVEKFNCADKMTHVSTGGGAFLTFVAKGTLPAVEVLAKAKERMQIPKQIIK